MQLGEEDHEQHVGIVLVLTDASTPLAGSGDRFSVRAEYYARSFINTIAPPEHDAMDSFSRR